MMIVFKVVFAVLIVVNICGNSLVCSVVLRNAVMKTPMNYLLVQLAICDAAFAIFFIPRKLIYDHVIGIHPAGIPGDILCKFVTYGNLSWLAFASSAFTLLVIGTERYYAIVYPHSFKGRFTTRRLKVSILACWVVAALLIVPETVALHFDSQRSTCGYQWPSAVLSMAIDIIWVFSVGLLPFVSLLLLYGRVVQKLWYAKHMASEATMVRQLRLRKKITKKVLTVTALFGICTLPGAIYVVVMAFVEKKYAGESDVVILKLHDQVLYQVKHLLYLINATVNPFIYAFQDKEFRRLMITTFPCSCRTGASSPDVHVTEVHPQSSLET